ncbi:hypothetical protein BJ742DRAFT_456230 [Cladochytrium replicatum]|nr:hypothetical protein BJ742DRAFT_456230 [Cladochytrium replicatum]
MEESIARTPPISVAGSAGTPRDVGTPKDEPSSYFHARQSSLGVSTPHGDSVDVAEPNGATGSAKLPSKLLFGFGKSSNSNSSTPTSSTTTPQKQFVPLKGSGNDTTPKMATKTLGTDTIIITTTPSSPSGSIAAPGQRYRTKSASAAIHGKRPWGADDNSDIEVSGLGVSHGPTSSNSMISIEGNPEYRHSTSIENFKGETSSAEDFLQLSLNESSAERYRTSSARSSKSERTTGRESASMNAIQKEVKKFLKLFPELEDEADTFGGGFQCAIEREVIWTGKIYYTGIHLAFHAKLFGKTAKIVADFRDVQLIEKKSTAGMFPNAIRVIASNVQYVFTNFMKRDVAFNELFEAWQLVNPLAAYSDGHVDQDGPDYTTEEDDLLLSTTSPLDVGTGRNIVRRPRQLMPTTAPRTVEDVMSTVITDDPDSDVGATTNEELDNSLNSSNGLKPIRSATVPSNLGAVGTDGNTSDAVSTTGRNRSTTISNTMSDTVRFFKRIVSSNVVDDQPSPVLSLSNGVAGVPPLSLSATPDLPIRVNTPLTAPANISLSTRDSPLTAGRKPAEPSPLGVSVITAPEESWPAEPADCGCDPGSHPDLTSFNDVFDMDVNAVFEMIFSEGGSEAYKEAHRQRETENLKFGPWAVDPATNKWTSRDLTYDVVFKAPMFAKTTTPSSEKQIVIKQDRLAVVVDVIVKTPKVPYGDTFSVYNRYCITHEAPGRTRMRVRARVDFTKKLMLKSTIESGAIDGITTFGKVLHEVVTAQAARMAGGVNGIKSPIDHPTNGHVTPDSAHDAVAALNAKDERRDSRPRKESATTPIASGKVGSEDTLLSTAYGVMLAVLSAMVEIFLRLVSYTGLLPPSGDLRDVVEEEMLPRGSKGRSSRQRSGDIDGDRQRKGQTRDSDISSMISQKNGMAVVALLGIAVCIGVLATVINLFWMADVDRRLGRIMDQFGQEAAPAQASASSSSSPVDYDKVYLEYLIQTHRRMAEMHNSVQSLHDRFGAMEQHFGQIQRGVDDAVGDLADLVIETNEGAATEEKEGGVPLDSSVTGRRKRRQELLKKMLRLIEEGDVGGASSVVSAGSGNGPSMEEVQAL